MDGFDNLKWSIHLEASSDLNKPGIPVDDVIIHPDYAEYQNDIGNLCSCEDKVIKKTVGTISKMHILTTHFIRENLKWPVWK